MMDSKNCGLYERLKDDNHALEVRLAGYIEENTANWVEIERLNAVIESNIDDGIDKVMAMSDEQINALAGYEGRSHEDQATIARQCMEIAQLKMQLRSAVDNPDDPVYWLHSASVLLGDTK
jgi:hypothetical protein